MSVLSVRDLAKSFGGVRAVAHVSFSVAAGELLAMIGPNGAGKSTCFNLINGQLQPDAGAISFEGTDIRRLPPHKRCALGIARTFQVAATFGSLTVRENVQIALLSVDGKMRSIVSPFPQGQEAMQLLERTGLHLQADRPCAELAYGDLKRVEFAIALAGRPRLLLMDEPTAGMAPAERHALMDLVREVARERNLSVLFTEHDMDVIFGYADRVMVLADGELIAQGAPADVRADAQVRRVYLGEDSGHA
jgi:ABC-type branched-subunit amino acid transport system ATPase component